MIDLGTERCDHRDSHDLAADRPTGNRCEATATHRIIWDDGRRFSFACAAHLTIDDAATVKPSSVEILKERGHQQ